MAVFMYMQVHMHTLLHTPFFFFAEMIDLADEFDDSTCGDGDAIY